MTPGRVETIAVNLDAITNPINLACRRNPDAVMISHGNGLPGAALGFKAKRWGGSKEGNHNARWRRRLMRRKSGVNGSKS